MAKDPNKVRAKRTAKPKRFYLMYEGDAPPQNMSFARNGDEALDMVDAAQVAGRKLSFARVTLPAPKSKSPEAA